MAVLNYPGASNSQKTCGAISFIDNIYHVRDRKGILSKANGVVSRTDGDLEVHLLDDYDTSNNDVWVVLPLLSGIYTGPCIFDKIRSTSTTVDVATDLIIFLIKDNF